MQQSEVMEQLKAYISNQILDGKDIGLNETTPLLEWGIINSLEITRLLSFIQVQFHVSIPLHQLVADQFTDLSSITHLVMESASNPSHL